MSAEHNKVANATKRVAESKAREEHKKDKAHNDVMWDENAAKREATASTAANSAASTSETRRYHDALLGGGNGSGKPLSLNMQLNHLEKARANMVAGAKEMKLSEEEEHTPEYKRQFAEDHERKLAELDERMRVLTSQGAKSESGANPFVYDPRKEKVEEPGMLSGIGDWFSHKTDGTTPKPVAPPAPKPLPGFTITKNK